MKLDIIIPVHSTNINKVYENMSFIIDTFRKILKNMDWSVTLSINGENRKEMVSLAKIYKKQFKEFDYICTNTIGKGAGVINGFLKSKADIMVFMDIDLATNLECINDLIKPIINKDCDISIGSRYLKDSMTKRTLKRLIISKVYLMIANVLLRIRYSDLQCGFKAINKKTKKEIIPLVNDRKWFFDTEMIFLANEKGFKIEEIPIIWKEQKETGIKTYNTFIMFLLKLIGLKTRCFFEDENEKI